MSNNKQTEKICSGCGRSSLNPIGEQHIACCPDNNYIEMSNNKQIMKLYTEIQLLEAIDRASLPNITIFDILNELTPIELPSDEEIKKEMEYDEFDPYDVAYFGGLSYMRDLIQGGNNEQG